MIATEDRYSDGCIKYSSLCPECSNTFTRKLKRATDTCNACNIKRTGEGLKDRKVISREDSKHKKTLDSLLVSTSGVNQKSLVEMFTYHIEGVLTNNFSTSNRSLKGNLSGSWSGNGYKMVSILGKKYYVHRLVYEYHNGTIPKGVEVDHKDRRPTNNRIDNLRVVTKSQNQQNTTPIGYTESKGKYVARIVVNGKVIRLGTFGTAEEAQESYYTAKNKYHI